MLVCRISPASYMHNKARASHPQTAPGVRASTASAVVSPPADGPDPQSPTYEAGPLPFCLRESAITARTSERSCTTRPGAGQPSTVVGDRHKLLVAPRWKSFEPPEGGGQASSMHAIVRYKCAPSHTRRSHGRRLFASCAVPERRQVRGVDMRVEQPRAGCKRPWAAGAAGPQEGQSLRPGETQAAALSAAALAASRHRRCSRRSSAQDAQAPAPCARPGTILDAQGWHMALRNSSCTVGLGVLAT